MIAASLKPTTTKQWAKLALIPVLSVVLLALLWQQPKPKSETTEAAVVAVQTPSTTSAASSANASGAAQSKPARPVWPKARLADIIAFNPFEAEQPEEFQAETAEVSQGGTVSSRSGDRSHPRLVSSNKLQAIYVDAQGAAAILDSQVLHVGDTLPNGGRVVEITPQGIKLEGL